MGFREMSLVVDMVGVLKPAPKFVLAMLADRAAARPELYGKASCWCGIEELARRTSQSQRTVIRHLQLLESLNLIEKQHRYITNERGQGRRIESVYIIDLPAIQAGRFLGEINGPQPVEKVIHNKESLSDNLSPKPQNPRSGYKCQNVTYSEFKCQEGPGLSDNSVTYLKEREINNPPYPPCAAGDEPGEPRSGGEPSSPSGAADAASGEGTTIDHQTASQAPVVRATRPNAGQPSAATPHQENETAAQNVSSGVITPLGPSANQDPVPEDDQPVSSADRELLAACMPPEFLAVPARDLRIFASKLRERLEYGWTPAQIRQVLASRPLPATVRNLPALVNARLNVDVPVTCAPLSTSQAMMPPVVELVTSNGQPVAPGQIDWWKVMQAKVQAEANGDPDAGLSKREFAVKKGLENFLAWRPKAVTTW